VISHELSTFGLHVMANHETERSYYAMRRKQQRGEGEAHQEKGAPKQRQ
jgi:hypothetical protein